MEQVAAIDRSGSDEALVRKALDLAAQGLGLVSPNPLVGCIIVSRSGEIVGEGIYRYEGLIHAEAIALEQAGERARGGTAYVSLEPHAHFSKTSPCTEALINAGISRVVCPIEDPNPLVSGRGFAALREAGIEVVTGILAGEASRINEQFICWHRHKRPFVHLKLAMSIDGRISLGKSVSTAISGEEARTNVQELRHAHDAILVGGNTVAIDNPSLTDRSGKPRRRPLMRVILDNRLRSKPESIVAKSTHDAPTIIFTNSGDQEAVDNLRQRGVSVITSESGARDLGFVLESLRKLDIQSILVEGGTEIAGAFCDARLVDKVTLIAAPFIVGGHSAPVAIGGSGAGSLASVLRLANLSVERVGSDIVMTGYPESTQARV